MQGAGGARVPGNPSNAAPLAALGVVPTPARSAGRDVIIGGVPTATTTHDSAATLRALRRRERLSQRALAERASTADVRVWQSDVCRLEAGQRPTRRNQQAHRIAAALGSNFEDVFGGDR